MAMQVMKRMRTLGKMGAYGENRDKGLLGIDGKIYPPSGILVPDPDGPGGMVSTRGGDVYDGIDMRYVKDKDLPPELLKLRQEDPEKYGYIGPKPGSISAWKESGKDHPRQRGLVLPKSPSEKQGYNVLSDPATPADTIRASGMLADPILKERGMQVDFTLNELARASFSRSIEEIDSTNDFINSMIKEGFDDKKEDEREMDL